MSVPCKETGPLHWGSCLDLMLMMVLSNSDTIIAETICVGCAFNTTANSHHQFGLPAFAWGDEPSLPSHQQVTKIERCVVYSYRSLQDLLDRKEHRLWSVLGRLFFKLFGFVTSLHLQCMLHVELGKLGTSSGLCCKSWTHFDHRWRITGSGSSHNLWLDFLIQSVLPALDWLNHQVLRYSFPYADLDNHAPIGWPTEAPCLWILKLLRIHVGDFSTVIFARSRHLPILEQTLL